MRKNLQNFALCTATSLLFLSGCHTFSPYGQWQDQRMWQNNPYGAQPPQGAYIAPPGQIQPGTNLGQPSTLNNSGSSYLGNGPTYNRSTDRSDQPQSIDSSSNNPSNTPVPNYKDPNENRFPANNPKNNGNSSEDLDSPFGNGKTSNSQSTTSDGVKFAEFSSSEKDDFKSPVSAASGLDQSTIGPKFAAEAAPDPYGHDVKNYAWLRGKVSFDKNAKTWHMIYSLNPDPQDKFGGDFTLLGVPQHLELEDGDVALVEGYVDNKSRDARGKPCYRINEMFHPLAPKADFAKDAKIQAQNVSQGESYLPSIVGGIQFPR